MPIRFRFSWIPFIAAVLAVALGVSLGHWQSRRAQEKEAIGAAMQARGAQPVVDLGAAVAADTTASAEEFRRVRVSGHFVGTWPLYLDNRPHERRAGLHLLMPFKIAGSNKTVLVARGWLPRDPVDRTRLPATPTPAGAVTIEGSIRSHPGRLYQFGASAPLQAGAIVQNVSVDEFAAASGLALLPFIIEQGGASGIAGAAGDGLVRDWPRPSHGADKHRGYAFQWYGLAAAAFIFFIVTGFLRGTRQQ
ncbi:SURF1 family protein [Noviherbaspirillum sedimenti]|uniref:SURF1-like protein n=1 Tax=Noviherbaspirillum sedimenti TaxID=2320865 RepID=A0A3A3G6J8_9BURK|nr:SURF1 family protein [Noviherbaspirillum sedimenti]RJG03561.1 SURF1 family protein [Noviherbaspirillum sedimenti]